MRNRAGWILGICLGLSGASASAGLRVEGPTRIPAGTEWIEMRAVDSATGLAKGAAGRVSRVDWAGASTTANAGASVAAADGTHWLAMPAGAKAGDRLQATFFDDRGQATRHSVEVIRADAPAYAMYGMMLNGRYDDALYPAELTNASFVVGNVGTLASAGGTITVTSNSESVEVLAGTVNVPRLAPGERFEVTGLRVRLRVSADIAEALELRLNWRTMEGVEGAALRKVRVSRAVLSARVDFGNPAQPEDGGVQPGTDGSIYVTLANTGSDPIREGTVNLRATECSEAMTTQLVLPALEPGASVRMAAPIRVRIPSQCVDGSAVKLMLEGDYLGQVVRAPIAAPLNFVSGLIRVVEQAATINAPIMVPDNNATGVMASNVVTATGVLRTIAVSVRITHPFIGDLRVKLVHPDGTEVVLHERTGGSDDNIYLTYGTGGTPIAGLNNLAGKPIQGTWKLMVIDLANGDIGSLDSFSFKLRGNIAQ